MSGPPLRLGIVGCGRLAEAGYLPAIAVTPAIQLVAVADPDAARRDRLVALAGSSRGEAVAAFVDASALFEGASVDALVLASPARAHLDDAALASSRGIPVLVEKPPAPDAATAAALAALDPAPWVGFNRRFDRGARRARAAIPVTGELALDLEISYRRASWSAYSVSDDALLDLGPHLVDWARWLTGADVTAVAASDVSPTRTVLELDTTRGPARLTAAVDRPHVERVEVRDARGRVVAKHHLGGLVSSVLDRVSGRSGPHALISTLATELDALASAVRGVPAPDLGTAADGVAVMEVIDAARASAASGGSRVPVPQLLER